MSERGLSQKHRGKEEGLVKETKIKIGKTTIVEVFFFPSSFSVMATPACRAGTSSHFYHNADMLGATK